MADDDVNAGFQYGPPGTFSGKPAGGGDFIYTPPKNPATFGDPAAPQGVLGTTLDFVRRAADKGTFGAYPAIESAVESNYTGRPFGETLREQHRLSNEAATRLGGLSPVAELTGGLATGAGMAKSGMTVLGRVMSPGAKALAGIGEGTLYGMAHGVGEAGGSNDPEDYWRGAGTGAATGALTGLAAPIMGGVLKAGADYGLGALSSKAGYPGGLTRAAMADEAALRAIPNTPNALLVDTPTMRKIGQGAYAGSSGPGHAALEQALTTRNEGVNARVSAAADARFGVTTGDREAKRAALKANMDAMGPEYDAAFGSPSVLAVDPQRIADHIANQSTKRGPAAKALAEVRGFLDVPGSPGVLDPHPDALHQTRMAIDGMMENEANSQVKKALGDVRRLIDDELRAKVPGIKDLDARFQEFASRREALAKSATGATAFEHGRAGYIHPNQLERELMQAAAPKGIMIGPSGEAAAIRENARDDLQRIIDTNQNDLLALRNRLGSVADQRKSSILFGEQPTRDLMSDIAREQNQRLSHQKILGGSKTAETLNAIEDTAGGTPRIPRTGWDASMRLLGGAWNTMRVGAGQEGRDQIARALAEQDPAAQRVFIDNLLKVAHGRDLITRALQRGVEQSVLGGGTALFAK